MYYSTDRKTDNTYKMIKRIEIDTRNYHKSKKTRQAMGFVAIAGTLVFLVGTAILCLEMDGNNKAEKIKEIEKNIVEHSDYFDFKFHSFMNVREDDKYLLRVNGLAFDNGFSSVFTSLDYSISKETYNYFERNSEYIVSRDGYGNLVCENRVDLIMSSLFSKVANIVTTTIVNKNEYDNQEIEAFISDYLKEKDNGMIVTEISKPMLVDGKVKFFINVIVDCKYAVETNYKFKSVKVQVTQSKINTQDSMSYVSNYVRNKNNCLTEVVNVEDVYLSAYAYNTFYVKQNDYEQAKMERVVKEQMSEDIAEMIK